MAKSDYSTELKKGSIQLCIMSLLTKERMYGFRMIKELRELSDGYFDLKEGTLYPALHRLEKKGYLVSEWVTSDDRPPKKYYRLTPDGKKALEDATEQWHTMVEHTTRILEGGGRKKAAKRPKKKQK
jgi:PadR family transcriptional regulator PadR